MERVVASRPARQGGAAVCRDAPWEDARVRLRAPAAGAMAIEDGHSRVLAVATPREPGSVWTPHVGFTVEGMSLRLVPPIGPLVACEPDERR